MTIQEGLRLAYQGVLERIQEEVLRMWASWNVHGVTVTVYGSQRSGVSLPSSDLDLAVSCYEENLGLRCCLAMLAANLGQVPWANQVVAVLGEHVRVPVVKLQVAPEIFNLPGWAELSVDITIHDHKCPELQPQEISVRTVQQFLTEMPLLRPLVLLTKQLLRYYNLNDSYRGGLSSFVWFLMVAAYIQLPETQRADRSLSELLLDLLLHYGPSFDPQSTVVRPVLAGVVPPLAQDAQAPGGSLRVLDPVSGANVAGTTFQFQAIQTMFDDIRQQLLTSNGAFANNETLLTIFDLRTYGEAITPSTFDEAVVDDPPPG